MDGNYLVVTCPRSVNSKENPTHALIDCGATGYAFINLDFAKYHDIPLHLLETPRTLDMIDGCKISLGDISHMAEGYFSIQEHQEKLPMFITKLGHYPIILSIPWLK
jgi:hypothetical protein